MNARNARNARYARSAAFHLGSLRDEYRPGCCRRLTGGAAVMDGHAEECYPPTGALRFTSLCVPWCDVLRAFDRDWEAPWLSNSVADAGHEITMDDLRAGLEALRAIPPVPQVHPATDDKIRDAVLRMAREAHEARYDHRLQVDRAVMVEGPRWGVVCSACNRTVVGEFRNPLPAATVMAPYKWDVVDYYRPEGFRNYALGQWVPPETSNGE